MNIILQILLPIRRRVRSLCLSLAFVFLSLIPSQALPLPHAQPASHAPQQPSQSSPVLQPLLAQQGNMEGIGERFARFVKPILILIAFVMVVAAGFIISREGNPEKAIFMLVGAFILLLAWFIVTSLAQIAN